MATIKKQLTLTFKQPNIAESYGPYTSKSAAHAALSEDQLNVIGMTVGIQTSNTIEEYWYQGGTTEQHLVKKQTASVEVDSALSSTSENPVLNKVVKSALDAKANASDIPSVPTISTNIESDANSDTKTTSPKAVKTFVEGKGYLTQHQDITRKADKVNNAISGNFAGLDANGNLTNSTYKAADFVQNITRGGSTLTKTNGVVDIPEEIENVVATPVAAGGSPTVDLTNGTLTFGIPSGADAVNPFKGWYDAITTGTPGIDLVVTDEDGNLVAAYPNPVIGDYAYIKTWDIDTTQSPQVETSITKIYECTIAGSWSDSGRTADTSNVQTFASSQEVNEVHIVNDLATGGTDDVLSAEQGKNLNEIVTQLNTDVNGKQAVTLSGAIPMVANTTNQRSSGAKCNINIPKGTYHFTIDTNYIGGSAQLYYMPSEGNGIGLGTVTNLNDKDITLEQDAVELYCWANASNSPQTGDCSFSLSQDGTRGMVDDIDDLNESTKSIQGKSNSTDVVFTLTTAGQYAASTKKNVVIKKGKYWVDVSPMSLLTNSTVNIYAYYESNPNTNITIGVIGLRMLDYWKLSGSTYLQEIEFTEDVVAMSMYHADNATNAGDITLSFVDQNAILSYDDKIEQLTKKSSPDFSAFSDSGELEAEGGVLSLPKIHVIKNSALSLEIDGTIENVSFGIGYSATTGIKRSYEGYWFVLTPSTLDLYYSDNSAVLVSSVNHGLTLDDRTMVSLRVTDDVDTRMLRITTKAGNFYENSTNFNFFGVGSPFVENNNTNSDIYVKISFLPCDISKRIWVFGDSYCGTRNPARWMKQIFDLGVNRFLLNARGGEAMAEAVSDLDNMLSLDYIPAYILWCLGMNGAADANSTTVSDYQKLWLMRFLRRCTQNGITPILCTIPTVPSLQHNAYNTYIKTLGYRIVDLADAVGAQSDGTWFAGLLSQDGVHPSEEGARVLANRVLLDFAEIQLL